MRTNLAAHDAPASQSTNVITFPQGLRAEDRTYQVLKRAVDLVGSLIGLALLLPVFFLISAVVYVSDRGPVLYKQQRVGKGGKLYWMYKFRSMRQDADKVLVDLLASDPDVRAEFEKTYKLKNDPRLLKCGPILRSSSLDELPQLINVLLGDMSLVGPRPVIEKEIPKLGDWYATYTRMKPGCAGLWQCSGRNDTSYEDRIALNERYYRTASIRTDFLVMWKTFVSIVARKGAY